MKKIYLFNDFITERINIDDNDFILIKKDNFFLLLDNKENPLGYISFSLTIDNVYSIFGAYSKKGYGPLLYELVMTYVYPNGITPSYDSTSGDALSVWEKFYNRKDVLKEPIKRNKKTDQEIDLIKGCNGDLDCLEWVDSIFYLLNNKYIYTLDINKLNILINNGDIFLKQNPDFKFDEIIYYLEGGSYRL